VVQVFVQQLQRKLNWEPPAIWTPLSWIATMSLVSLGWIFFRADSLAEAGQMWLAVVSPSSYLTHFMSGSVYLLVALVAVGYLAAMLVIAAFDSFSQDAEAAAHPVLARIVRLRWYWIPTLYILALLFVSIVTITQSASTLQFMYSHF
jgi:hypothetical protein